jgi:hypothetical protein
MDEEGKGREFLRKFNRFISAYQFGSGGDMMRRTFTFQVLMLILIFAFPSIMILSNAQNDDSDPEAIIKPFVEVSTGESVEFNGTQSYDPGHEENLTKGISEWKWYIRPQSDHWENQTMVGNGSVLQYVVDKPKVYTVNLSVTDMSGLTGWTEKLLLVHGPDLQINSINFIGPEISDLTEGDRPIISIHITNSGTVTINSTWIIRIMDGTDILKESSIMRPIEPGETIYFNQTGSELKAGERTFRAVLDAEDDIDEMTNENNAMEIVIVVQEEPGLFGDSVDDGSFLLSFLIFIIAIVVISIIIVVGAVIVYILRKKT